MHNTPAAASPKPFDLTSTAFLIVLFTGIAGALQTPTLSLFLTNEVHARPAMVGFFFTGERHHWHPGQPVSGRAFRQKRRSQKPDCFLLSAGRFRLRVVAWNRNYFILLFVGVFLSSFG